MRIVLLALAWLSLASLASPRQGGITYTSRQAMSI